MFRFLKRIKYEWVLESESIRIYSNMYIFVTLWCGGVVEGRLGLRWEWSLVAFKSRLGAVWGRSLGPVALRQPQSLCICIVLSCCVIKFVVPCEEMHSSWVSGKRDKLGPFGLIGGRRRTMHHIIGRRVGEDLGWWTNGGDLGRICRTINLTMVIIPSIIHRHQHDDHCPQHHHRQRWGGPSSSLSLSSEIIFVTSDTSSACVKLLLLG